MSVPYAVIELVIQVPESMMDETMYPVMEPLYMSFVRDIRSCANRLAQDRGWSVIITEPDSSNQQLLDRLLEEMNQ